MCSIDLDPCSVSRNVTRKARKAHSCSTCGGPIRAGETYHYSSWVFDGTAGSGKQCAPCHADMVTFSEAHDAYPADPGYFRTLLEECIVGDDDASLWRPMLARIELRGKAA
jgi:hypothetical protein